MRYKHRRSAQQQTEKAIPRNGDRRNRPIPVEDDLFHNPNARGAYAAREQLAEEKEREEFANRYIQKIFDSKIAKRGGPVRRKRASVEKLVSLNRLLDEIKRRHFHALQIGDQLVIMCSNPGKLDILL